MIDSNLCCNWIDCASVVEGDEGELLGAVTGDCACEVACSAVSARQAMSKHRVSLILQPFPFAGGPPDEIFFQPLRQALAGRPSKMDGEDGFAFGCLAKVDVAAMLLRDLLSEGESKPGATLSSLAHEGQKDLLTNRSRHSRAIVCDFNLNGSFALDKAQAYRRRQIAAFRCLTGVEQQIVDRTSKFL